MIDLTARFMLWLDKSVIVFLMTMATVVLFIIQAFVVGIVSESVGNFILMLIAGVAYFFTFITVVVIPKSLRNKEKIGSFDIGFVTGCFCVATVILSAISTVANGFLSMETFLGSVAYLSWLVLIALVLIQCLSAIIVVLVLAAKRDDLIHSIRRGLIIRSQEA